MWRRLTSWIIVLMILLSTVDINAEEIEAKHILIVLVPGFSFEEARLLVETDQDRSLWQQATVGAMNVRPNGPYSYLNNMVTLSIGEKAIGVQGWNAFEAGETINEIEVRDWMRQVSGELIETDIYHPDFYRLASKNGYHNQGRELGRFGDSLKQAGVERIVYGHSDTSETRVRYGSLLILDEEGKGTGELNRAVRQNRSASYGFEMDMDYLINKLSTNVESDRLTVIEWGDIHRLYEQRFFMEETQFQKKHNEQLLRLSAFLEEVIKKEIDVWLLAPMMHEQAYDHKQQLAPVFYWGGEEGGFFTSNTTRQPYLVSSIDFVPTILQSFGIHTDDEWTGHAIMHEDRGNLDKRPFFKKIDEIVFIYKSRASVLSSYISCLVLALVGAAAFCFFATKKQETWRLVIRLLLLSALWSPFWFLALSKLIVWVGCLDLLLRLLVHHSSVDIVCKR